MLNLKKRLEMVKGIRKSVPCSIRGRLFVYYFHPKTPNIKLVWYLIELALLLWFIRSSRYILPPWIKEVLNSKKSLICLHHSPFYRRQKIYTKNIPPLLLFCPWFLYWFLPFIKMILNTYSTFSNDFYNLLHFTFMLYILLLVLLKQ